MLYTDRSVKRSSSLPVSVLTDFLTGIADDAKPVVRRLFELVATDRLEDARVHYDQHPYLEQWLFQWGESLMYQGMADKARRLYQHALDLNPANLQIRNAMGALYQRQGRLEDARKTFETVLEQDAAYLPAHLNMARLQLERGYWQEARDICERILERHGDRMPALEILISGCMATANWAPLDGLLERFSACLTAGDEAVPVALSDLYCLPLDGQQLLELARRYSDNISRHMAKTRDKLSFISRHATRKPGRRIRLGYISGDFGNSPRGLLMARLLELHNRKEFDVYAYALSPEDGSQTHKKFFVDADVFRDIGHLTISEAACQIYADGIDLLIDLAGYHGGNRPEILALRPAPLQLSWMGTPASSGAEFIDYFISDQVSMGAAQEGAISESPLLLPLAAHITNNQQPVPRFAPERSQWGLPLHEVVFCCFNPIRRIDPGLFATWMRILEQVPGSILWLQAGHPEARSNLQQQAREHGIDAQRLLFLEDNSLDFEEALNRQACADIYLDTRFFNGHETLCQALWAGVPVITCKGETLPARLGASLLEGTGLPQLVTTDLAAYESAAVQLARDPDELQRHKAHLINRRMDLRLFDTRRTVQNLEKGLHAIWKRKLNQEPPARTVIVDPDVH